MHALPRKQWVCVVLSLLCNAIPSTPIFNFVAFVFTIFFVRVSSPECWFLEFSSVPNFKFFYLHALDFVASSFRLDLHGFCFLPSFFALNFCLILFLFFCHVYYFFTFAYNLVFNCSLCLCYGTFCFCRNIFIRKLFAFYILNLFITVLCRHLPFVFAFNTRSLANRLNILSLW